MNKEDFVTYEQALSLKKLGFDLEVNHYYDDYKELIESFAICSHGGSFDSTATAYDDFNHGYCDEIYCSAPTLAQAQKWLRKKGLIICINPRFYMNRKPLMGYDYCLYKTGRTYIDSTTVYDSYEEALSSGISECLKLLKQ